MTVHLAVCTMRIHFFCLRPIFHKKNVSSEPCQSWTVAEANRPIPNSAPQDTMQVCTALLTGRLEIGAVRSARTAGALIDVAVGAYVYGARLP